MDFPNPFNLAAYFLDHNLAARADKVAVCFRDEQYTYRQVYESACRFANAARGLGVRQEDRVLIMLPDCPAFVTAVMGTHKVGAVLTMVNPRLPADDLLYYFNYTKAPLAVIDASLAETVNAMRSQLQYLRYALVVEGLQPSAPNPAEAAPSNPQSERSSPAVAGNPKSQDSRGILPFLHVLSDQSPEFQNAPVHPNDPAVWLFTSGSTGKPKGAVHYGHDFAFNTEQYAKKVLKLTESDRTISVARLFFGYGTGTNLWFPFAVGGTTCLFDEHPTPEIMFEKIAQFRPTFLTTVPTMMNKMLASPRCENADLSSLRLGVSAGEKLPAEVYERWIKRTGVEVLDGIGSAEMFHIYISNYPDDVKIGSLGKLVPGYESKLVDDCGAPIKPGQIGTLWIKGDSMMTGYYQDRVQSQDRLHGEWLNTSDMFRQDDDGYFWYEGRADDLLKVGGIFVSPGEIENCLLQHKSVAECAVIGVPDESGLIRPKAFVVPKPGYTGSPTLSAELIDFVKGRLARYKAPTWVAYLDCLPRNDRGKVERKKLTPLPTQGGTHAQG